MQLSQTKTTIRLFAGRGGERIYRTTRYPASRDLLVHSKPHQITEIIEDNQFT